ncbi:polysaccharide biosynthesis/export family protein [Trinickia dinghuensis]|uniref:Sugar ABC transporter substrate-binding protein n=1 Tax=Trinickia dinghuensis TaxID=2291023 RepID=A0A3D8JXF6_9BURK|nr:polysaccharide biosynthesis/export family protein [Trinickia dinghuensis]RDU97326.1 sugar ABC transporter substrate-binding protein [Trinickia dinghuensis]
MKTTLQQLAQTQGSTRASAAKACKTALAVLPMLLGACSVVPGQHMETPPSIPVSSAPDGTVQQAEQIPIQAIDLNLIRQLNAGADQMQMADQLNLFAKPTPYKLGPGDVLQITVWDHPELAAALGQQTQDSKPADPTQGFVIDGSGNLSFPYLSHPIHAAGQTIEQVQREVHADLSKEFRQPQVTVRIASYRSAQVYVDGEVRAPGGEAINDIPMTLTEAINRAGGFTANADRSHLTLTREGKSYPIDLTLLTKNGKNPQDIMLKPGDMLRVTGRDENTAYVMGEVNKPIAATPTTDGTLTLSDALSQAGFINQGTANARQLYVIREQGGKPEVYHLDSASPVSMLLANQFDLHPKDVVYVDNGPLVRFNRVLSLLLPAINAGLTAAIVTK